MPKLKTHKGMKKRFKVSATGKVTHKKCGSSHLMSHKSGKQVRRLRKKQVLKVLAEAQRIRRAVRQRMETNPAAVAAERLLMLSDRELLLEAEKLGLLDDLDPETSTEAEAAVDPAVLPSEA